jgi:hypothetical protein
MPRFADIAWRGGMVLAAVALVAGIAVAGWALAGGLHALIDGQLGEKAAAERLALIPIGACVAGGIAALPGLLLAYLGGRAAPHR